MVYAYHVSSKRLIQVFDANYRMELSQRKPLHAILELSAFSPWVIVE